MSEGIVKPRRVRGKTGPKIQGGSRDARRVAATILDVLGGMRTPPQAAEELGWSLPRYYSVESRALEGFVAGCEPRERKRGVTPQKEAALLCAQVKRLEMQLARQQALLRATHRSIGLSEPAQPKGKRRRRPTVRALKATDVLRSEPAAEAQPTP